MHTQVFEIGAWRLEGAAALFRGDRRVRLGPKELETLLFLVGHHGRVVCRDELRRAIWPDVSVTDASLTRCVYLLRSALGEDGEAYIETVPRRGYRFVGPVRRVAADGSPAPIRLGVLPFRTAGPDADSAYLVEGLVGEVIARLSRLHGYGLTVLSRYATDPLHRAGRTLDEIGRELRLDYVLTGTAWVRNESFRVRAELVRASDGAAVWSESFERPRTDVERVQVEIASSLANRLPLCLPSLVRTQLSRVLYGDPRVYDAYLQARYHWGRRGSEDLARALDLYRCIVAWDPGYAPAHLGVANSYLMLASWYQMAPLEAGARARESTRMALELDPDLAGAHAAQGLEESLIRWDPGAASASFRRALALDPADPDVLLFHAMHLLACGRAEEAVPEAERALDLDAYSIPTRLMLALARMYAGDSGEAIAEARRAVELDRDFSPSQRTLAVVLSFVGDHEEAVEAAEQGLALTPKDPMALPPLAYSQARAGQLGEARRAQDAFARWADECYVHASLAAPAALAMDDTEGALRWLERAGTQRCNWLAVLLSDPRLAPLREEPRFRALERRVRATNALPRAEIFSS